MYTSVPIRSSILVSLALIWFSSAADAAVPGVVTVPAGTPIRTVLKTTVGTATARTGDVIVTELAEPLTVKGRVVAPAGSRVEGRVIAATTSGRLARPATLEFKMTELTPTGGRPVKITTTHYFRKGQSHTKRDAEYIAGGAAVGAILGQVIGKNTESTLEGTAAGAVAGTGLAAATGELDFTVEAGRVVTVKLTKPVQMRAIGE